MSFAKHVGTSSTNMDLFVYEVSANTSFETVPADALEIRTCQRSLLISFERIPMLYSRRTFEGTPAYEFLLRFASGLESEIKGETDVFGQVKTAFKPWIESRVSHAVSFQHLFSKLIEDTKEIRAQYLQGIGGHTYGALARKILNPTSNDSVLILGAGQISKSIAPYFAEFGLKIYNRSSDRLIELLSNLSKKGYSRLLGVSDSFQLPELFARASIVIVATPAGSELDQTVIKFAHPQSKILHMGGDSRALSAFRDAGVSILTLSDLFEMEKEQSLLREKQIHQAMEACRSRALLRSLAPRSISIPHGWEDLALFY